MQDDERSPLVSIDGVLRNLPSDTGSASTVYDWIRSGKLPSVKVGKRRMVRRRDLAAFLGVEPSEIIG